jgi:hypothetical protein
MHARYGSSDDQPLDLRGALEDGVGPEHMFIAVHIRPLTSEFVPDCSFESRDVPPKVGMKVGMAGREIG